jgi:hypothetical protein
MCDWKVIVPEATRNIIYNPSFELSAFDWLTGGANTIESSNEQSFVGDKSAKITYADSLLLARWPVTLTAEPYTFTVMVRIPTAWDGGVLSLAINTFSGATIQQQTNTAGERDDWVELTMTFTPDAGDLAGFLELYTASAPTLGLIVYLDAAQCEQKEYPTTHCDGDQEGCSWDGSPHASASRRQATSRAGGRVMDLEDDFGFRVQRWPGTGFAPVDNISRERATQPGATFQRARLTSRTFILSGTLIGDDPDDLLLKREALIPVLSPFAYDGGPVTFRYTGARTVKQIRARYAGGLELDEVIWRYEKLALPFWAEDPRWYALGENSEELAVDTFTTRLILAKIGGEWSNLGPPDAAGTYTNIRDMKQGPDGKIYVCGDFLNFDNVAAADYIAAYDPINNIWTAVGSPNSGGATITSILKLAFDSNGNLYAVGNFTNLAGVANADYIAVWDGSTWAAVGNPNSGGATITDIRAVAYGWGNRLWVGGDFTNLAGIAAADRIAYFQIDTATWTAAGGAGADGEVNDIWALPNVNIVYAGGTFGSIDGVASTNVIVRFLGDWMAMTGLETADPVNRLYVTANGYVYIVADEVDGTSRIAAYWNGEKWLSLGGKPDDSAYALTQRPTGEIVVGGAFENVITADGGEVIVPAKGAAYWNGSIWSPPEFLLPGSPTVYTALALPNGDLYFGYDTTGNANVPAVSVITNNGTAPAYPVFRLLQSGGAPSPLIAIENATTGKRITFAYDLKPGKDLWIDLRPKTLGMYEIYSPRGWNSEFIRFFRFGPDASLTDFVLQRGENLINLYVEASSGATIAANVRWTDSYEGLEG